MERNEAISICQLAFNNDHLTMDNGLQGEK